MQKKYIQQLLLSISIILIFSTVQASALFTFDFSNNKDGDAKQWLKDNQFEFKKDPGDLTLVFKDGSLVFDAKSDLLALMSLKKEIKGVKRIRIEWGVNQYPVNANWEKEVKREALGVVLSFGTETVDSGNWIVPNLPYFITLFLGEKEIANKAYTGSYYFIGGRYVCVPCGGEIDKTIITNFELPQNFKSFFGESKMPPITSISFEVDIRGLDSGSRAFIKKIEFLSE